jgi:predicted amidophosphoribosyltransferase
MLTPKALLDRWIAAWRLPCALCGELARPGQICSACLAAARHPAQRCCPRCGVGVDLEDGLAPLCPACRTLPPAFERTWALLRYEPPWDGLVLAFKSGRFHHAAWMAREMIALLPVPPGPDSLMVPVPAGRRSRLQRGSNPAAVLARACAKQSGATLAIDAVWRCHESPLQHRLGRNARESAMINVFAATPRLYGRCVLLIDDVMTTGSTLDAMARAVRAAGARQVDALVLARTP